MDEKKIHLEVDKHLSDSCVKTIACSMCCASLPINRTKDYRNVTCNNCKRTTSFKKAKEGKESSRSCRSVIHLRRRPLHGISSKTACGYRLIGSTSLLHTDVKEEVTCFRCQGTSLYNWLWSRDSEEEKEDGPVRQRAVDQYMQSDFNHRIQVGFAHQEEFSRQGELE